MKYFDYIDMNVSNMGNILKLLRFETKIFVHSKK